MIRQVETQTAGEGDGKLADRLKKKSKPSRKTDRRAEIQTEQTDKLTVIIQTNQTDRQEGR